MNRIRELRLEHDMTQPVLAQILSVTVSTISKYENENMSLNDDVLRKLSEFFNASIDYILYESDIRNPEGTSFQKPVLIDKIHETQNKPTPVTESGPNSQNLVDTKLMDLLSNASPDLKNAMIALLEQSQNDQ